MAIQSRLLPRKARLPRVPFEDDYPEPGSETPEQRKALLAWRDELIEAINERIIEVRSKGKEHRSQATRTKGLFSFQSMEEEALLERESVYEEVYEQWQEDVEKKVDLFASLNKTRMKLFERPAFTKAQYEEILSDADTRAFVETYHKNPHDAALLGHRALVLNAGIQGEEPAHSGVSFYLRAIEMEPEEAKEFAHRYLYLNPADARFVAGTYKVFTATQKKVILPYIGTTVDRVPWERLMEDLRTPHKSLSKSGSKRRLDRINEVLKEMGLLHRGQGESFKLHPRLINFLRGPSWCSFLHSWLDQAHLPRRHEPRTNASRVVQPRPASC